jgi:hypothetical protein
VCRSSSACLSTVLRCATSCSLPESACTCVTSWSSASMDPLLFSSSENYTSSKRSMHQFGGQPAKLSVDCERPSSPARCNAPSCVSSAAKLGLGFHMRVMLMQFIAWPDRFCPEQRSTVLFLGSVLTSNTE